MRFIKRTLEGSWVIHALANRAYVTEALVRQIPGLSVS